MNKPYKNIITDKIVSFANTLHTIDGGTHEQGFRMSLANVVNKYAFDFKKLKEGNARLKGDDILEGVVAVVSVKLSDAQFESQTKAKLGNTSIGKLVRDLVNEKLYQYLEENPDEAKIIIDKYSVLCISIAGIAVLSARVTDKRDRVLLKLKFTTV